MATMPKYYKIHTDGCTVELEPIYEELVPVKHGRWVLGTTNYYEWMKCSECLHSYDVTGVFVYCPNCGAKMRGETE